MSRILLRTTYDKQTTMANPNVIVYRPGSPMMDRAEAPAPALTEGPYVVRRTETSLWVIWQTSVKTTGGILIREAGTEEFRTCWMVNDAGEIYGDNLDHWVCVRGLKPATTYEYLVFRRDHDDTIVNFTQNPFGTSTLDADEGTRIVNGPYLFNADTRAVSIGWRTSVPLGAGIDIRKAGDTDFRTVWQTAGHQIQVNSSVHIVDIGNLEPGCTYEYRPVAYDPDRTRRVHGEGLYTFRTFTPRKDAYRVLFLSDQHAHTDIQAKFLRLGEVRKADFVVYGGDNLWDGFHEDGGLGLFSDFIDCAVEHHAKEIPCVFVRGNHEWSGRYSNEWMSWLRTREGKTYYAFLHGGVFYIVLDSGNCSAGDLFSHAEQVFQDQREWLLTRILPSDAFKSAAFRVVITHIATHGQSDGASQQMMRKYFMDLINRADPQCRIHLMLAGHEHRYMRVDPRSPACKVFPYNYDGKQARAVSGEAFNYAMVSNDGPTCGGLDATLVIMDVTPDKLVLQTLGPDGTRIDAFSIDQNGNVTDDMPVPEYPY